MKILVATTNEGKIREFEQIFAEKFEILTLNDLSIEIDVEEKYYYGPDKYMYKELKASMKNPETAYQWRRKYAVSYTHLTLPTILLV